MEQSPPEHLWLAEAWLQNKERLTNLLIVRMPQVLQGRMSVEDVLQETYLACGKRLDFLRSQPEVPVYAKLRRVALQTLTDIERRHFNEGRDVNKEHAVLSDNSVDGWARFAASVSGPRTNMERQERQDMVRRVLNKLSDSDREVLELRHFELLGNGECAAVLGIEPKAASIRYVRALKRFEKLILEENYF